MSFCIVLLPAAQAEFDEAIDWYDRQRPGLGEDLVDCVQEVLDRIAVMPERHAIVQSDIRRGKVRRFPYSIFYYVDTDQVVIISIFHSKRDPKIWQSRR